MVDCAEGPLKSLLQKSPTGVVILSTMALVSMVAAITSHIATIVKEWRVPLGILAYVIILSALIAALILCHRYFNRWQEALRPAAPSPGTPPETASPELPIVRENRQKRSALFQLELSLVSVNVKFSPARMRLEFRFINGSIFDGIVRKLIYDLTITRGIGSPNTPIIDNRSYDHEVQVVHQGGNSVHDGFNIDVGVAAAITEHVRAAARDRSGVTFQATVVAYVDFLEGATEKSQTMVSREVPYYSIPLKDDFDL